MRSTLLLSITAAISLSVPAWTTAIQVLEPPLRMTAFAVNMSNVGRGGANTVIIEIERWSTDAQRERLITAFKEKGPSGLLSALQKERRIGYMRLPNSLGYDLQYARKHPGADGGAQIIILTDRHIGFWEARDRPRTIDYPFTLLDIRLNASGEGEGKLSVATKITYSEKKGTVELENYASEPVRLQNIKTEAKR